MHANPDATCPFGTRYGTRVKNLVLIGFMGTGKSAVGRKVAQRLGRSFIDLDERIEAREGQAIAEIFRAKGEPYFRDVESAVIAEAAVQGGVVIATGGGAVLRPQNVERLKANGLLICLRADAATIAKRVSRKPSRPLLAGEGDLRERVERLLAQRAPAYAVADVTIDSDDHPVARVVEEVLCHAKLLG